MNTPLWIGRARFERDGRVWIESHGVFANEFDMAKHIRNRTK